jgi:hypothetical protein
MMKNEWRDTRNEVDRARRELGFEEVLHLFSSDEASQLYKQIEARFSVKPGARWIWEHLRLPASFRQFPDDRAYLRLPLLVSDANEEVLSWPGVTKTARVCIEGLWMPFLLSWATVSPLSMSSCLPISPG